ncbi:MAG: LptF/LptG family permease [Desulfocapsaceae bacterium]|nr:LptF/LptG family permease [Desulfocapsaceae bacterium]
MKLLYRYLLGQFVRNFLTVAIGFVAIYLLIDFFDKIDHFTRVGKSFREALTFFFLNVPFILDQLGPVLILLAGIITFGILNHNHELLALKASGIPLRVIIGPILLAGVCTTGLSLAMAQWILPITISASDKIWNEDVQGKVPLGAHRNGRYYYKGAEGFYSFQWQDPGKYIFRNYSYSTWDAEFHMSTMITCDRAEYSKGTWHLYSGQMQTRKSNGYEIQLFEEQQLNTPESPDVFFIPQYKPEQMSLSELYREMGKTDTETEILKTKADFFGRISYILLGLPLLLLGLPILVLSYQKWGRDLSIAIPASCGIAFIAWGIWGALQSLAREAYVYPLFSATIVHCIFASVGLFLLYKQDA